MFSPRRACVIGHIADGKTNKEIAKAMSISLDTVKEHVSYILRKLNLTTRTQVAVWAVQNKEKWSCGCSQHTDSSASLSTQATEGSFK